MMSEVQIQRKRGVYQSVVQRAAETARTQRLSSEDRHLLALLEVEREKSEVASTLHY